MDLFIYDLPVSKVDDFINPSSDKYGRVIRRETLLNQTVDLVFHIQSVYVTEKVITIMFPNDCICSVPLPIDCYHKLEIL